MENNDLAVVLCLTFLVIVLFNAIIIIWARRKEPSGEVQVFRKIIKTARNPFHQTDSNLKELAGLVNKLQSPESERQENDHEE